jgi:uncharacterized protein
VNRIGWTASIIAVPVLAMTLALAGPDALNPVTPAAAQQQERSSGGGLLRLLFGGGERAREAPQAIQPAQQTRQRRAPQRRAQTAPAPQQRAAAVDKSEDARKVLVVGDFVTGGLGEGLEDAYGDNPDVAIVTRSNGSSGLVRDDYYDWPGNLQGILETEEPDIVIVMIGANDRQQLVVNGRREEPRSDPWMAEYEVRVRQMVDIVREQEAHLVWVGMVPFRFRSMSSDMIAFNDLYRRVVEEAGGDYVDVWDGFVDEDGAFVTAGPDMNGQPAQLRAGDGINITRAGKRKIAFYVEKPLNRLLAGASVPAMAGFGPRLPIDLEQDDAGAGDVDRTHPISLDDAVLFGGSELLGGRTGSGEQGASRRPQSLDDASPRPGRADDFRMRRPEGEGAAEL